MRPEPPGIIQPRPANSPPAARLPLQRRRSSSPRPQPRARYQTLPGHAKGDGAYVLSRRPDFIILGPANGARLDDPWFLSDLQIANDPHFRLHYRRRVVLIDVRSRPGYHLYVGTHLGLMPFMYYERIR